jgi:protein-L-isoaspartate(D-aspartate) O-methyltransferase
MEDIATARRHYADELRYVAGVRSAAVTEAFAAVPRERFLGPGPWQICSGPGPDKYWQSESADPSCVYHNVVIGLISERGLNNGQPSFWAGNFDQLDVAPGKSVLHLGCGTGYFTAILAELVGPSGRVTVVELEENLAAKARENLALWPHVSVIAGDGSRHAAAEVDIIVVNAGATHPLPIWFEALPPGGQLLVPLTTDHGWGQLLVVTRRHDAASFAARFIGAVGIFNFEGARDPDAGKRLAAALMGRDAATVQSLRRDPHEAEESCWLHAPDFCLSRRESDA